MAGVSDRAPTRIRQWMDPWLAEQPDAPALRVAFAALSYRELHDASVARIVGLTAQFMGNPSAGSSLVLSPRFTPAETARMLREEGITICTGVPTMMAKMLDCSLETGTPLTALRLRLVTVAGSPMTPALKHDAGQAFDLPRDNGYGLTECAPRIAQTRIGESRSDCTVGDPIPDVEMRIVSADASASPAAT